MIQKLILTATVLICCATAFSQGRLSVGLELASATGDMNNIYGVGYGGTLGFEMPVGPLGVFAHAGFMTFGAGVFPNLMVIPAQVGLKYYVLKNRVGPYVGVMGGVHMTSCDGCPAGTNISYAPTIGYLITEKIDVGIRYQLYKDERTFGLIKETFTMSYLGLRAAYGF